MGYYDHNWDHLPKKIPYDSLLQVISVITHLILPIPMHLVKRNEENRDLEQRQVVDENLANNQKHLFDLIFTYYILFVLFTAYIDLVFLNK